MYITDKFYKHYETEQDLAIAIFFAVDHNQSIDIDVIEKLLKENPHIQNKPEAIGELSVQYSKKYAARKKMMLNNLSSNRTIRNLARQIKTSISLSATAKIITEEIGMICADACQIDYEDIFTNDTIDILLDLLTDQDHLNDLFITTIQKVIYYTRETKQTDNVQFLILDDLMKIYADYLYAHINNTDPEPYKVGISTILSTL